MFRDDPPAMMHVLEYLMHELRIYREDSEFNLFVDSVDSRDLDATDLLNEDPITKNNDIGMDVLSLFL